MSTFGWLALKASASDMPVTLARLRADGFDVSASGETLKVSPTRKITPELRSLIGNNKPALLVELAAEAERLAPYRAALRTGALVLCANCAYCVPRPDASPNAWCRHYEEGVWVNVPFRCPRYDASRYME